MLRETENFRAEKVKEGVRISTKNRQNMPRARVVSERTWEALSNMNDREFDGSCVLELGIGTYRK